MEAQELAKKVSAVFDGCPPHIMATAISMYVMALEATGAIPEGIIEHCIGLSRQAIKNQISQN